MPKNVKKKQTEKTDGFQEAINLYYIRLRYIVLFSTIPFLAILAKITDFKTLQDLLFSLYVPGWIVIGYLLLTVLCWVIRKMFEDDIFEITASFFMGLNDLFIAFYIVSFSFFLFFNHSGQHLKEISFGTVGLIIFLFLHFVYILFIMALRKNTTPIKQASLLILIAFLLLMSYIYKPILNLA